MSKAHPGKSKVYQKKILRRNEREPERELLNLAKEVFYEKFPGSELKSHR